VRQRNAVLFFLLPFLGLFLFFTLASFLGQADLKRRTQVLVRGQLRATAGILAATVGHYLDEGRPAASALDDVLSEEDLYFVALLDDKNDVLAWNSRFEGYLPISLSQAGGNVSGIIDSPAGRIFSELVPVATKDGRKLRLYMGYALTGMEEMIARSRRTALLLGALILAAGALFFSGVYRLQSRYVAKAREAEAERQEKERFREIAAFTSGVAHEIKNPLNSLSLVFELLGRKAPPEAKGDLELGRSQVRTISRIVDRFSRVIKAVRPETEALTVDDVLRLAAGSLTAELPSAAARLRVESAPGLRVNADRDLLVQAVLNIMKNAVEASPGAPVCVSGSRAGRMVEIVVRDEGPGLAAEAVSRLFDPFYTTKEKGMGIGLYLAKRIVEAHGGTIEAQSREGQGTQFRIRIPGGPT
jgi:signal transduction histidine kinase